MGRVEEYSSSSAVVLLLTLAVMVNCACAEGLIDGELCVVETLLATPYFKAEAEIETQCNGCMYLNGSTAPRQVHVVHVAQPVGGVVEMTVTGGHQQSLVLALHSGAKSPVTFFVKGDNSSKHFIMVTGEDSVRAKDFQHSLLQRPRSSLEDLLEALLSQFGVVTSFTRALSANKIFLQLDIGPTSPDETKTCSTNTIQKSPLAQCWVSAEQTVSGCYHNSMIGIQGRDIHIIELDKSSDYNNNITLSVVGLVEEEGEKNIIGRNLTLVLKTSMQTKWTLHTANLHGTIKILVGGDDQVENSSRSSSVLVEVQTINMPTTFDVLIIQVLNTVGAPVSYTRTVAANRITVFVPSSLSTSKNRKFDQYGHYESSSLEKQDPEEIFRENMIVRCFRTFMEVSVPRKLAQKLGVLSLTLAERSCRSKWNATHLVLTAKYKDCKFMEQSLGPTKKQYTTFIDVEMSLAFIDDEDFEGGSGLGSEEYYGAKIRPIHAQCKVSPQDFALTKQAFESKLSKVTFGMQVYENREQKKLITKEDYPLTVSTGEELYVRASYDSDEEIPLDYEIKILLEKCWLSISDNPKDTLSDHEILVQKNCRAKDFVSLLQESVIDSPGFKFLVLSEFLRMKSVFLHCQMGVCHEDALNRPSVSKCIDPSTYCNKRGLIHLFDGLDSSSYVDTVTAGPFVFVTRNNAALSGKKLYNNVVSDLSSSNSVSNEMEDNTQVVVFQGLSTAIVVGIALASFVIGVFLTGSLWAIYMKTDPRRLNQPACNAPRRNSGYDLSAHSGSSTPSSQAPMNA